MGRFGGRDIDVLARHVRRAGRVGPVPPRAEWPNRLWPDRFIILSDGFRGPRHPGKSRRYRPVGMKGLEMPPGLSQLAPWADALAYAVVEPSDKEPIRAISSEGGTDWAAILAQGGPHRVRAVPTRADCAGLAHHLKVVWQRAGRSTLMFAGKTVSIDPGQAFLVPLGTPYSLEIETDYEAMMIVVDPRRFRGWQEPYRERLGRPLAMDLPLTAAAASTATLPNMPASSAANDVVLEAVIELVFAASFRTQPDDGFDPDSGDRLRRSIRAAIERNMADRLYSPSRLARDLGMSRRSLYSRMAMLGLTPGASIRDARLERAHRRIREENGGSLRLTELALETGFVDSSSFSRAFRAKYGLAPRTPLIPPSDRDNHSVQEPKAAGQ